MQPPRWRCLVRPCHLGGRWQSAPSNRAADEQARTHYLVNHLTPPAEGEAGR
ncbi:hypothetical protein [Thermobispora bispora]|uniref:hypothetical protein n=1 Tax=Thermobispora bispora TaxID=2006 RepID=UPI001981DAC6|nr:hypothetical protein [Thermobispora bispora]